MTSIIVHLASVALAASLLFNQAYAENVGEADFQSLKLCVQDNNAPFERQSPDYQGIYADFLNLVLGKTTTLQLIPTQNSVETIQGVKTHLCDLAIVQTLTPSIEDKSLPTQTLTYFPLAVASQSTKKILNPFDVIEHIAVKNRLILEDAKRRYPETVFVSVLSNDVGMTMVASEKASLFLDSLPSLIEHSKYSPSKNLKIVQLLDEQVAVQLVFNPNRMDLYRAVKSQLTGLTQSDFDAILNDWYPIQTQAVSFHNHGFNMPIYFCISLFFIALILGYILKSRKFKKENDLIRSELETTRHELLNMSQQVNQTIKFSEIISHEYRTPVSVISANIDILEIINAKSSLGLTKYLTKMRASIEKLIAIVETSKVKESLAANKLVAHKKPFDFNPLLYRVLADVQLVYKKHRIDVVGHDEEITLNGDIDLIGLLLKNILENACKYSPVNEPIVIKVDVDHQHLILTIRDKGIGIPENDIDSIFEKYHRAGNTSNTPGIGVGLYLSKQVAMQHQGDIRVTSTPIDGTEVTVLLPLGKHP